MNVNVYQNTDLCMRGKELRWLRCDAGLSRQKLADKMGWYRQLIERMEAKHEICLPPHEMQQLLSTIESFKNNK